MVPMIRLWEGSVGWTQIAGSSGSFGSAAVAYAGSISNAVDSIDGAGDGFVESWSGAAPLWRHPSGPDETRQRSIPAASAL
jgi:hypothetical protein